MFFATPTGLRRRSTSKAIHLPVYAGRVFVTTPLGLRDSLAVFPRVAEYRNPGLEDGSPSGKMSKLQGPTAKGCPQEGVANPRARSSATRLDKPRADEDHTFNRINFQPFFAVAPRSPFTAGRLKLKALPRPGMLETVTVPPCASTIFFTRLRPRPLP